MSSHVHAGCPVKNLVLLGGGHSHLFVLKSFGMHKLPGVRLTLVTKDIDTPYSGMLPGYVSGFYSFDECHVDLSKLAAFADARMIHSECRGLDVHNQELQFEDRPPLKYDCLSVDIGITPRLQGIPGWEHVTPVKPISKFVERVDALLAHVLSEEQQTEIVVVGGGAGGVEVAFALHHRLSSMEHDGGQKTVAVPSQSGPSNRCAFSLSLVTRGTVLAGSPAQARRLVLCSAASKGIKVHEQSEVQRIDPGALCLANGVRVTFGECLWCIGAAPADWLQQVDVPKVNGFIAVNEYLQSAGGPDNVFACGDVATSVVDPRPKAGVFAVRQGQPLTENLRRHLTGRSLIPFHPQRSWLSLITTGEKHVIATKSIFTFSGRWLWSWKDRIDRAFMAKFSTDIPDMSSAAQGQLPPAVAASDRASQAAWLDTNMPCKGCAAKVGPAELRQVLWGLNSKGATSALEHGLIMRPCGSVTAFEDVAVMPEVPSGHVQVQTVDFINACTSDLYLFGRIAALHALSDCYAAGAAPCAALITAQVARAGPHIIREDLKQMMTGVQAELARCGCELLGGHSCLGSEAALGVSVTGTVHPEALMSKRALRPGQVLILTKALGNGILLRAAMLGKAPGRWQKEVWSSMLQSNRQASEILVEHGVRACTDVSGFGLLGHALEMAEASEVHIELDLAAVPILNGTQALIDVGIKSTADLHNRAALRKVCEPQAVEGLPALPALLDPQTSGGLLAGVDDSLVAQVLQGLSLAGYNAHVVGMCSDLKPTGLITLKSKL